MFRFRKISRVKNIPAHLFSLFPMSRYQQNCLKLISQYKAAMSNLSIDLDTFMKEYGLECKAAETRLLSGVPANIEHGDPGAHTSSSDTQRCAEITQHFITALDALQLEMVDVDQLHPLISDVVNGMNRVSFLSNFEGKTKLTGWLKVLNGMNASDTLDERQGRQLAFDLDEAYSGFMNILRT
eukprot:TRINITY_DN496_c0_g1_i1.p1 TRINITY_DN496_c0_g1~~TRINITY_DN496_c0_g1_i1.p1  ORF type:complete len:183 (-),score=46.20 TRINITY_DN496_c0_g1_i1:21-569(-)